MTMRHQIRRSSPRIPGVMMPLLRALWLHTPAQFLAAALPLASEPVPSPYRARSGGSTDALQLSALAASHEDENDNKDATSTTTTINNNSNNNNRELRFHECFRAGMSRGASCLLRLRA
eukprot:GHVU01026757.1.p1 GENE.GHVU01026757.1~~GHVU01026757.1.p1  ORF type:complete len:119 (+),score=16.72 GHVU01026757.1:8-364(+)